MEIFPDLRVGGIRKTIESVLMRSCKQLTPLFSRYIGWFALAGLVLLVIPASVFGQSVNNVQPQALNAENLEIIQVAAADAHTCAILRNTEIGMSKVMCWGSNDVGELGIGSISKNSRTPIKVANLNENVISITTGGGSTSAGHSCALMDNGSVHCWGNNNYGQIGIGARFPVRGYASPEQVIGLDSKIVEVAAGYGHTCALSEHGHVKCWGQNSYGAIGDGSFENKIVPTDVVGLTEDVEAIEAGGWHRLGSLSSGFSCALLSTKAVQCWGDNQYGQLGNSGVLSSTAPLTVTGILTSVNAISLGGAHACALIEDGGVNCWGNNDYGQLGYGYVLSNTAPVRVTGLVDPVDSVSSGGAHTCALLQDGKIVCWGDNHYGQLGNDTNTRSNVPVEVTGLPSKAISIAAGDQYTCAILENGDVTCWGDNRLGQLGVSDGGEPRLPASVNGLSGNISSLSLTDRNSCAHMDDGKVACWGSNRIYQLGDLTPLMSSTPLNIKDVSSVRQLSINGSLYSGQSCVLVEGNDVLCWGYAYGSPMTPLQLRDFAGQVTSISVGGGHTCVVLDNGKALCWGSNFVGQLGNGTTDPSTGNTATEVIGIPEPIQTISAGTSSTCAITRSGGVYCWGRNDWGQLGNGEASPSYTTANPVPTQVVGLTRDVKEVVVGYIHACSLMNNGAVKCWGRRAGEGSDIDSNIPVEVAGLENISAISAKREHTCVLSSEGSVMCWGRNEQGQIGNRVTTNETSSFVSYISSPTQVTGLTSGVTAIATGHYHSCAIVQGTNVQCWGTDEYGQLGRGRTVMSSTPVKVAFLQPSQFLPLLIYD